MKIKIKITILCLNPLFRTFLILSYIILLNCLFCSNIIAQGCIIGSVFCSEKSSIQEEFSMFSLPNSCITEDIKTTPHPGVFPLSDYDEGGMLKIDPKTMPGILNSSHKELPDIMGVNVLRKTYCLKSPFFFNSSLTDLQELNDTLPVGMPYSKYASMDGNTLFNVCNSIFKEIYSLCKQKRYTEIEDIITLMRTYHVSKYAIFPTEYAEVNTMTSPFSLILRTGILMYIDQHDPLVGKILKVLYMEGYNNSANTELINIEQATKRILEIIKFYKKLIKPIQT